MRRPLRAFEGEKRRKTGGCKVKDGFGFRKEKNLKELGKKYYELGELKTFARGVAATR